MRFSNLDQRIFNLWAIFLVGLFTFISWVTLKQFEIFPKAQSILAQFGFVFFLFAIVYDLWSLMVGIFQFIVKRRELKLDSIIRRKLLSLFATVLITAVLGISMFRFAYYHSIELVIGFENQSERVVKSTVILLGERSLKEVGPIQSSQRLELRVLVKGEGGPIVVHVNFENGETLVGRLIGYVDPPYSRLPQVEVVVRNNEIRTTYIVNE